MNFSVTCHVEVISDVPESPVQDVLPSAIFKAQAHALRRGRAVNNKQGNGSHRPMQELIPNTPARAVATATSALRTMPHTDFDFVLMLFKYELIFNA